jgi:exodeoxyribonuclease-5
MNRSQGFYGNRFEPIEPPVFKRRRKQITDWEELEDEMRGALDFNALSDDQKDVFEKVMKWYEPGADILTLGGFAGTGKSTLVSIIARELEHAGADGQFRIAFCAYTGKAANVLRQKLRHAGVDASILGHPHYAGTIHSLIYKPIESGSGAVTDWVLKDESEVSEYSLIVVDEASMVDEKMLDDLKSYDVPILAVGDHGQLAPIKGQSNLMLDPDLRLEQIHRQAEDNPIIQLSKHIREIGYLPEDWKNTEHVRFCTFEQMFDLLEPLYATESVNDIAILTYKNTTRKAMNYQARCMRNKRHMDDRPIVGDQFICLKNVRGTLFNGMRGTLETEPKLHQSYWYNGRFFFPDDELEVSGGILIPQIGREKTFSEYAEINSITNTNWETWGKFGMLFDYGYALTVHKSQGSQFKHVFLMYERPGHASADDFRRWLYTATTRARETLTIVVG